MRYLLCILVVLIGSSTIARAFSCDELYPRLKDNVALGEVYQEMYKRAAPDDASRCRFARDIFLPYSDKSIAMFTPYMQCPKHGKIATELVEKLKTYRAIFEAEKIRVCK